MPRPFRLTIQKLTNPRLIKAAHLFGLPSPGWADMISRTEKHLDSLIDQYVGNPPVSDWVTPSRPAPPPPDEAGSTLPAAEHLALLLQRAAGKPFQRSA